MSAAESEREMVQRHVREGEGHVARQRELVAELRERGDPAEMAVALLAEFEDLLGLHRAHLSRLDDKNSTHTA